MSGENFYLANEEVSAAPYHYETCGLDNIYLLNGYEIIERDGESYVAVKSADELHRAIGRHVVFERKSLTGNDIRFLRNTLDLTQAELARSLATTAQTLARWEKGEVEITGPAERLLRVVFMLAIASEEEREALMHHFTRMVFESLDSLDEMDQVSVPVARFVLSGGWKETQLAACASR